MGTDKTKSEGIDSDKVCRYNISTNLFEWDPVKNATNIKKHGVSFEEAATVFDDENIIFILDGNHSYDEERFIALGISVQSRLLLVCHCNRNNDSVTRIISARRAEHDEEAIYFKKYFKAKADN